MEKIYTVRISHKKTKRLYSKSKDREKKIYFRWCLFFYKFNFPFPQINKKIKKNKHNNIEERNNTATRPPPQQQHKNDVVFIGEEESSFSESKP